MTQPDAEFRSVCPECGLPGVPILYGEPGERAWADAGAGLVVLGGCEIGPDMDDFVCPGHHRWRAEDAAPGA